MVVRTLVLLLVLGLGLPAAGETSKDLATARQHRQRGRYPQAVDLYTAVLGSADSARKPEAIVGLAESLLETGEWEEAEKQLAAGVDQHPDSAALRAALARLHLRRGRHTESRKQAELALEKEGENLLARLVRAGVKKEEGELEAAAEDCRWFVTHYNRRQPKDAASLLMIAEGAAEYARARSVGQVFSFIVNDVTPDALKADEDAWEACFISGSLLLEKYNNAQARQEFERGLKINPRSADLLVGMARAEFDDRNIEEARSFAEKALSINPRHPGALLQLADLALAAEQPEQALTWLDRALEIDPRLQGAAGRKAACDLLINGLPADGLTLAMVSDPASVKSRFPNRHFLSLTETILEHNRAPGEFLTAMGSVLEQARRYDAATTCYARAIDVAPTLSAPRTALGLLQMRTGDLVSARKILDDAFRADRFHVRVSNMRKVLDVLERYETISTEHFIIRFDSSDKVLAGYLAEELEGLYGPMTQEFGFEPPERTAFEIFSAAKGQSGHAWFSARMTGMPWIQTIGASTGMLVALSSPTTREPYNWARVVRHEFAHVITLQQTGFAIPHWYTEALAVRTEGKVFPDVWRRLLIDRHRDGTLFTLETVNNGFQRPKNGDDWQHAYCMSRLYARFMEERYGRDSLFRLVAAYREGLKTPAAVRQVFGKSVTELEAEFRVFLDGVLAELNDGRVPRGPAREQAEADLKQHPDDIDRQAAVAWALLSDAPPARADEAEQIAKRILKQSEKHPLALATLARIDLRNRREQSAARRLEEAFNPDDPHPAVVSLAGRLAIENEDFDSAARLFGAGLKRYPRESGYTYWLAVSLLKLKLTDRLPDLFRQVAEHDFDDLTSRHWLLANAVKREDWPDAIRWGREAMHIDVRNADTHRQLGLAYLRTGDRTRAERHLKTALELKPGDVEAKRLLEERTNK